ncbi:MAG: type II toxin-antitoxin system ParD family antitoxin [Sphingomonadales bacterium]
MKLIFKVNIGQIMASTSMTLGPHWEGFIKSEIESGRYASASEVVRAALRELEDKSKSLAALRTHLAEGASEAAAGHYIEDWSVDGLIADAEQ